MPQKQKMCNRADKKTLMSETGDKTVRNMNEMGFTGKAADESEIRFLLWPQRPNKSCRDFCLNLF